MIIDHIDPEAEGSTTVLTVVVHLYMLLLCCSGVPRCGLHTINHRINTVYLSMSVISLGGIERIRQTAGAQRVVLNHVCVRVCVLALRWLRLMLQNISQVLQRAAVQVLPPGSSSGGECDVNEDD